MAETGPRFQEGQGQASPGNDGVKAMWGSMQARAKARRAQSQPCGQGELSKTLRSMDHFGSHQSGSTSPSCVSGVSTPRSEARSDIWTSEDDSVGSERGEPWLPVAGTASQWVYSVPRGCRVRNGFIEFDDPDDDDDDDDVPPMSRTTDPAAARRGVGLQPSSPTSAASAASGQHSAAQVAYDVSDMPIPAADEPLRVGMSRAGGAGRGRPAAAASSREPCSIPADPVGPDVAGEASSKATSGDASTMKSRPRPSKPKRLQGKALAERLFRAQWRGNREEIARAREAFQEETKGDPLMQSYTLSVLRCLNSEASSKAANGEDPMLTATHS